jgi:Zn-dependent peptidase ImmA (M78 family)
MLKIRFVNYPHRKHKTMRGAYYCEAKLILIKKSLKLRTKIGVILHELGHYIIDKLGLSRHYDYVYDVICVLVRPLYNPKRATFMWLCKYYYEKE